VYPVVERADGTVVVDLEDDALEGPEDEILGLRGIGGEHKGRGHQLGIRESYRGSNYCIDLIPKTRIELIVNDEELEDAIDAIVESARTGEIGDGKIFVSDVLEVVRIRTGERGSKAV
jgi:nitrogen regulatory protein P-II 1